MARREAWPNRSRALLETPRARRRPRPRRGRLCDRPWVAHRL